jgi:hypothetical protein
MRCLYSVVDNRIFYSPEQNFLRKKCSSQSTLVKSEGEPRWAADLGVDAKSDSFIDAVKKSEANVLARSAISTATAMK